ncbi:hypothetical protein [Spirulina sp. 06S082]|uniref:sulfotransferase-like domain-containing protein n=1 Tax=Spirulina sp. 06S082 TaxID=3110248 RepID=UPI002B1F6491|nr:hypothetical protein [Spirulina sp. 06S082]MEA5468868.1 hypothetical protein [Spirulina sp. 06S082]
MKKILALWAIPRSTSTAFERMMRERGDFLVCDEPFGLSFYYSPDRCNTTRYLEAELDPSNSFNSVLEKLKQENEKQPVFIKDMAYHIDPIVSPKFLSHFENTFLIRNPAKSLPSLFNGWPDFNQKEAGYTSLYQLFEIVRKMRGNAPVLIDSDDLVQKPKATIQAYCKALDLPFIEESLEWKPEPQSEINQWEGGWHTYVQSSTEFKERINRDYVIIKDNEHLRQSYEFCLPYYKKLYEYRLLIE